MTVQNDIINYPNALNIYFYKNMVRSLIAYLYEGGCAYRSLVDFYKMNYKKKLLQVVSLSHILIFVYIVYWIYYYYYNVFIYLNKNNIKNY